MEYTSSVNNNNDNCENNLQKPDLELKSKDQCNYFKSSYARSLSFSKNRSKPLNLSVNHERANIDCELSEMDSDSYKSMNVIDDDIKYQQKKSPTEQNRHSNQRASADTSYFDSILLQTQVNTLQWQLKQVESTRQMYQTVLEEVLRFLKKCYQHLNLLMEPWPRSRSEKHIVNIDRNCEHISNLETMRAQSTINLHNIAVPGLVDRDFQTFTRAGDNNNNQFNLNPDTEKLSNEAFRLYRTTENLINMPGPTLIPIPQNNGEFRNKVKNLQPKRTNDSFLNESKLIDLPEHKIKNIDDISLRSCTTGSIHSNSSKSSETNDEDMVQNTSKISSIISKQSSSARTRSIHTISPNCIDVESGFSSMNSFQEIGLPLVNSTQILTTPNFNSFSISNHESEKTDQYQIVNNEVLQTDCTIQRKWNSLPMSSKKTPAPLFEFKCDETLKVLWV